MDTKNIDPKKLSIGLAFCGVFILGIIYGKVLFTKNCKKELSKQNNVIQKIEETKKLIYSNDNNESVDEFEESKPIKKIPIINIKGDNVSKINSEIKSLSYSYESIDYEVYKSSKYYSLKISALCKNCNKDYQTKYFIYNIDSSTGDIASTEKFLKDNYISESNLEYKVKYALDKYYSQINDSNFDSEQIKSLIIANCKYSQMYIDKDNKLHIILNTINPNEEGIGIHDFELI